MNHESQALLDALLNGPTWVDNYVSRETGEEADE